MSGFFTIIESAGNGMGSTILQTSNTAASVTTASGQIPRSSSAIPSVDSKSRTKAESVTDQTQIRSSVTRAITSSLSISTSRPEAITSATEFLPSPSSPTPSTFETSITSFSVFSLSIAQSTPTVTHTPPAVNTEEGTSNIPIAGIVVASFMGLFALLGVLFIAFRYCPPIRRRYEAWQEEKHESRTRRDLIDELEISTDKLSSDGSVEASSFKGHRFYAPMQPESGPNTRVPHVQETGLGLGHRLSLLKQHAPFQGGHPDTRLSQIGIAVGSPRHEYKPAPLPK